MKVSGDATLHAPIEQVWSSLNDLDVLAHAIPGCERLEPTGAGSYRMVVCTGVGAIAGTYAGEVTVTDQHEPDSLCMTASGSGEPGSVRSEVRVSLSDAGGGATRLTYDADAVVHGAVAGIGQRLLLGVANRLAGEFFASMDEALASRATEQPAAAAERAAAEHAVGAEPAAAATPESGSRRAAAPCRGGFLAGVCVGIAITLAGAVAVRARHRGR